MDERFQQGLPILDVNSSASPADMARQLPLVAYPSAVIPRSHFSAAALSPFLIQPSTRKILGAELGESAARKHSSRHSSAVPMFRICNVACGFLCCWQGLKGSWSSCEWSGFRVQGPGFKV